MMNKQVGRAYGIHGILFESYGQADQKLKELTDGEWTVNAVWSIGNQWRIQYVPSIDQIPCVYSTIDYTADDTYASNLDYE